MRKNCIAYILHVTRFTQVVHKLSYLFLVNCAISSRFLWHLSHGIDLRCVANIRVYDTQRHRASGSHEYHVHLSHPTHCEKGTRVASRQHSIYQSYLTSAHDNDPSYLFPVKLVLNLLLVTATAQQIDNYVYLKHPCKLFM